MKGVAILLMLVLVCSILRVGTVFSEQKERAPKIDIFEGKFFTSIKDPEYKDYEMALRDRLMRRIRQKFGIDLSPETYSGFDLLEIESFLRIKKAHEPLDSFLKMFPKVP